MRTAIYCVSKTGYKTCLKVKENVYNNLHIYVSGRVANLLNLENENIENLFIINERVPILLEKTFNKYDLHIFVAATGAVVRIIEGKFKSKDTDPAVITIDDHANFVISLLSGHLGGANEECKKIASGIGAIPVITTASDVGGKIAVDTLSQKIKAKLNDLDGAKRVTSLIVNGENVSLHLPKNIVNNYENSAGAIIVSNRKNIEISKIIPQNIFIGIGCKRGVSKEHIIEKLKYAMDKQNLELSAIKMAASAWVKSDETGLLEAMKELDIPIKFFEKEEILKLEDLIEEKSEYVKKTIGVYGVSEPCAFLASSGKGAFLAKKIKLDGMTLSIFEEVIENQEGK
ncbi:cobalt-precorrin 5A hydrolase [Leptotrichia massiliensis]|uniref:cobalt-precorrin 5A hydrolase n=1 Tax=Leptotrichia massiliensis TaxID=1852388 RepID=UPI0028E63DF0|nr:cobalt-precorrin 5A hydrolase [Leptotrichia massiliensis]